MMTYGYSVKGHDDTYMNVVEAAVRSFSECTEPGAYLVDVIPLRESSFLPAALPGILTFSFLRTTSAIRPRLVPWSGLEGESQALREAIRRHDGDPSSIRKGSDGRLMVLPKGLYSLYLLPPPVPAGVGWSRTERPRWAGTVLTMKYFYTRRCRLLERPFRRSHPNCLTARRSLQKSNIISNGPPLRYIQVGPVILQSDQVRQYSRCTFAIRLSHSYLQAEQTL